MHKQCVCVSGISFQHLQGTETMISARSAACVCGGVTDAHLRVLEKSVFFDAFNEHELIVAVPGPV